MWWVVAGLLLYAVVILGMWVVGRRVAAKAIATLLPNLVLLCKDLLGDPRVPLRAKVALGFAALWIASPIDLLPEFLPVIGPLDDVIVAALVLRYVVRHAGADVVRERWRGDPKMLERVFRAARVRT
jgi:uncharacterized membrane protein YkvA (DUF1232 family)